MKLLEGKTALVFGIANDHSIAWGIAQAMHDHGARLAFSYSSQTLERRVRPLADEVDAVHLTCIASVDVFIEIDYLSNSFHLLGSLGFLDLKVVFSVLEYLPNSLLGILNFGGVHGKA